MSVETGFCGLRRVSLLRLLGVVALTSALITHTAVRAQAESDAVGVTTIVDPCVPIDVAHFHRLLEIELGTSIDYRADARNEPGRSWVHVSCSAFGIELTLEDGITRKSMIRVLDVSQIEAASRTRLLALAVAEFVVASWVELRVVPHPAVPAVGPAPPPRAAQAAERTVQRRVELRERLAVATKPWELALGAGLASYTSYQALLPTLSLRLTLYHASLLAYALGADVSFMHVRAIRRGMSVGTIDLTGSSAMAAVLLGHQFEDVSVYGGAGGRFGVVRMTGTSNLAALDSKQRYVPHGGLLLVGRVGYRIGEYVKLGLELELGVVTLAAQGRASNQPVLDLAGGWVAAGLRAAILF